MYSIAAIVDKGLFKPNNEDRILINRDVYDEIIISKEIEESNVLLAVADGVGGSSAGEVAATAVLQEVSNIYPFVENDIVKCIEKKINECYDKLNILVRENSNLSDMATTLTGIVIYSGKIITFNLGDSRVYRFRNGALRKLTKDDSMAQNLIDSGMLEQSEYDNFFGKNTITKYINGEGKLFKPSIEIHDIFIQKGDIFCVTSDGVHDYISIDLFEEILSQNITLAEMTEKIIREIKKKDNHDNISIILLQEDV